jgi:hypothetical protein
MTMTQVSPSPHACFTPGPRNRPSRPARFSQPDTSRSFQRREAKLSPGHDGRLNDVFGRGRAIGVWPPIVGHRSAVALVALAALGCAHPPERKTTVTPSPVTQVGEPPPPSGSYVAPGIDVAPTDIGDAIIVRARLLAREDACDKYCWYRVKVLSVIANNSYQNVSQDIRVASLSSGRGIPPGPSTVYLLPYNKYVPSHLWRLAEDSRGTPLIPTDAQVARAWSQALLGDQLDWLPEVTALPFRLRLTRSDGRCQRDVKSPAELGEWSGCVNQGSDPFIEGLRWTERRVVPGGLTKASPQLKKLAEGIEAPSNWVLLTGEFNGFHSTLLLRIQGEGSRKRVSDALGDVVLDSRGVAEVKRRGHYESMVRAIDRGDAQAVQNLIGQGADVNDAGRDDFPGEIPIVAAAAKGDLPIVEVLLEAGANPDACCCACVTALHRAIEGGHSFVVARLLKAGADPRIRYDGGISTLELARRGGHPEIVRHIENALARLPPAK